jgi:hypothetical protein
LTCQLRWCQIQPVKQFNYRYSRHQRTLHDCFV